MKIEIIKICGNAVKAVVTGKFIAYIRKEERSKFNNLCFHLRKSSKA